jgi:hypothetical protein
MVMIGGVGRPCVVVSVGENSYRTRLRYWRLKKNILRRSIPN